MSLQTNLPRWIHASVQKWIEDHKQDFPLYIEGDDRATQSLSDFFELRIDGPWLNELTQLQYKATVMVNILVNSKRDEKDAHKIHRMTGSAVGCLTSKIPVFKYGDGTEDDNTLVGCLVQKLAAPSTTIQISHLGQVDPDIPVMQATLESHYVGDFDGTV